MTNPATTFPAQSKPEVRTDSTIIVIPTYNERDNAPILIDKIRSYAPGVEILIVDDNSPDGTAKFIRDIQPQTPGLHLLERQAKEGLGYAYRAGFRWALERGYQRIGQMDADLSHNPADLPRLLEASQTYDLVIGSRYIKGGGTEGWPLKRRMLSRSANFYARTMLRLPVHDLTGAFKCWQRQALAALDLESFKASGYVFMVETTWRAVRAGYKVKEVPIIFRERERGASKMGMKVAIEGLGQVLRFSVKR